MEVASVFIQQDHEQDYVWRRVQNSMVQSEKQRKSLIQMTLLFHQRAGQLQKDRALGFKTIII